MDFNDACLHETTLNLHIHAWIFSHLSVASIDSKQHLNEVAFRALVGFSLLEKYPTFGRWKKNRHTWIARNPREPGKPQESGFFFYQKRLNQSAGNVLEHCRNGGVNCLLTSAPVSCAAQHHIGDGGHPCSTHWWLFDPVVHTSGVQWKSNKKNKNFLTQMLLAINWCYWLVGKNSHVYEGSMFASCNWAS